MIESYDAYLIKPLGGIIPAQILNDRNCWKGVLNCRAPRMVSVLSGLALIVDDEGADVRKATNFRLPPETIYGDCLLVAVDSDGDLIDLTPEQALFGLNAILHR